MMDGDKLVRYFNEVGRQIQILYRGRYFYDIFWGSQRKKNKSPAIKFQKCLYRKQRKSKKNSPNCSFIFGV